MTLYGATKPCAHCGRWLDLEMFPVSHVPRADGARALRRFCVDCVTTITTPGVRTPEQKRAITKVIQRESRLRRRRQTGRWS